MSTFGRVLLGLLFLASLDACKDNFPKATEIIHMRILGSTLEVVGDTTRSTPKPGEHVRVTMAAVFPKFETYSSGAPPQDADVNSMFVACTAPSRFTGGVPVCQEFLDLATSNGGADISAALPIGKTRIHCSDLAQISTGPLTYGGVSIGCVQGEPVTEIAVQKDFKAKQKLLLGVVCERGDPYINPSDPLLFACDHDSGETIRVNALIPVEQKPSDENHNPDIDQVLVLLDPGDTDNFKDLGGRDGGTPVKDDGYIDPAKSEALWQPAEFGALKQTKDKNNQDDCTTISAPGSMLPPVDTAPNHRIALFVPPSLRKDGDKAEDLEISIFATAGKLERRFSLFPASTPTVNGYLQNEVGWDAPKPSELMTKGSSTPFGLLVRFFVTLRDGRGGFAMTTRAACARLQ